jgi:hypothetical protein
MIQTSELFKRMEAANAEAVQWNAAAVASRGEIPVYTEKLDSTDGLDCGDWN